MRHVPVPGAVMMMLVVGGVAVAQSGPDVRYVTVPQAEARSGPSDSTEFYATNRLARGGRVDVTAEMPGGWLQVKPPQGSFSYINTRFLRHVHPDVPNHVVTLDGVKVPVYMGSEVLNRRPTVVGSWLEPGAQVISRGKPVTDDEGTWMPIEPPARERRFIRASAVGKTAPADALAQASATEAVATRSAFAPTAAPVSPVPSAAPQQSPEQMWRQAEHAERTGQLAEAIRLYALVGAGTVGSNPSLSALALQRAQFLQGGYRNYGVGAVAQPPTATPVSTAGAGRSYPLPAANGVEAVRMGAPTAPAGLAPANVVTTTLQRDNSQFTPLAPTGSPPRGMPSSWSGYKGVLRRAGRTVEGATTYALDDPTTLRPVVYATGGQGVNLEAHLNKVVQLWGYTVWRGDLRNNYITVSRIVPE
ncbi:MAG: hypothetical protein U0736_02165 [Gemmataceae bacterium]